MNNYTEIQPEEETPKQSGPLKKILLIGGLVVLLSVGGFLFFSQSSVGSVSIEIVAPEEVKMGQPFEAEINISNSSPDNLLESKLTISLPSGLLLLDGSGRRNEVRDIGEISNTGITKEKVRLIAVPSESNGAHNLRASLTYTTESLSAFFNKNASLDIPPQERNFDMQMTIPAVILSGQEFSSKITLNTDSLEVDGDLAEDFSGARYLLILEDENEIELVSSDPESERSNLRWQIPVGAEDDLFELNLVARAVNVSGEVLSLKPKVVLSFAGEDYELDSIDKSPLLAPSPLTLSIKLADPKSYAFPEETLNYVVTLKNNTEVPLRNVVIRAQLLGEMFEISSVETDGQVNSLEGSIAWRSNDFDELASLGVGRQIAFSFGVDVSEEYPITNPSDKDFVLRVNASAESPTITQGVSTDRTFTEASLQTKVAGDLDLTSLVYFDDEEYSNSGNIPPKVDNETTLTVRWRVENKGTDVRDTQLRSRLSSNTRFVEVLSVPEGSSFDFSDSTNDLSWGLGDLSAGEGILTEDPELVFKVAIEPNSSQVGNFVPIMDLITVSAVDDFTGVSLSGSSGPLDTGDINDSGFDTEDGRVIDNE